jgi:heptosyltransferase-2
MYRNILVVRTDKIGDVVLTTAALRALRKKFPAAKISVLLSPNTRDLVEGNPDVDRVLFDDKAGSHRGMGYLRLIRDIRRCHFDLAIVYHTKKRMNFLCWAAGIPVRLGYKNEKFGFLLNVPLLDDRPLGKKHEVRYCLDVLEKLGITDAPSVLHVPTRAHNDAWADNWMRRCGLSPGHGLIAVSPSASCPTRRWPVIRFIELIPALQSRFKAPVVIVGGAEGRLMAEEIQRAVPGPIYNLTGETTLGQLASLLKRCKLLVSNDSGPVHLAAALGTPVVSIFTRNQPGINPERWKPLGEKSIYVAPDEDMSISFAKGKVYDPAFLYTVTTQEVLRAVDALFKLC